MIWELGTANAKNTASAQRIIFDKHWHSWNQAKADAGIDTVCERCGEPDSLKHLLVECQHVHGKEVRDECLATVKHDLLYNIATENREFADLLFTLITNDSDRHCMYAGLWTSGLRQRLGEVSVAYIQIIQKRNLKNGKRFWSVLGSLFFFLASAFFCFLACSLFLPALSLLASAMRSLKDMAVCRGISSISWNLNPDRLRAA